MDKKTLRPRILGADIIRILAILLVVILHGPKTPNPNFFWLVLYTNTPVCISLFVMISGALLLGKKEDYLVFYKKRLAKIFIPWIFWIDIYAYTDVYFFGTKAFSFSLEYFHYLYQFFLTRLWFLPLIFILYVFTPLFRIAIQHAEKKLLIGMLILWIIFVSVLPSLRVLLNLGEQHDNNYLILFTGFYFLGYFLTKLKKTNLNIMLFSVMLALGLLATTVLSFLPDATISKLITGYPYQFISPNAIFVAAGTFAILWMFFNKLYSYTNSVYKIIVNLSNASFGIYLVHFLVMEIFSKSVYKINLSLFKNGLIPVEFLLTLSAFIVSFLCIYLIQKIPVLKYVSP